MYLIIYSRNMNVYIYVSVKYFKEKLIITNLNSFINDQKNMEFNFFKHQIPNSIFKELFCAKSVEYFMSKWESDDKANRLTRHANK